MSSTNKSAAPNGASLPIRLVPDPVLRKTARAVTPDDAAEIATLIPAMFATMYAAPGIGLAAPQIGRLLRLVVMDIAPDQTPAPKVLINPEILESSTETATREEGCLSLPEQYADVTRPAWVRVKYQDEHGARHEIAGDGLLAACLQHEIDHLNGVLFVDYLSALKRNILLRKLAKDIRDRAGKK
ncbi:MAG: peptide deformylase [Acidocella sp.]|nr:peptide deformylase [Acidocella sp.]